MPPENLSALRLWARTGSRRIADRLSFRLLDALPGAIAWLTAGTTIALAWSAPRLALSAAAALAVYCALRFGLALLALRRGLRLIRQWEHTDWASPDPAPAQHVILLPNAHEPEALLQRTLEALAAHPEAAHMTVVLAMEGAEPGAEAKGDRLRAAFAGRFARVLVTLHPADLPGEIACKSANLAWVARHLPPLLAGMPGYAPDRVLITVMDADTLWHPAYFTCLGTLFARSPQRHRTIWQAPIRYHAKVWQTHPFVRALHAYACAWELAYLAAPWWQALPMSSYSLSLALLETAGGWDADAIADEWHLAIKAFFALEGQLQVQPVYLPFLAQAAGTGSLWEALRERYRQTLRHAWGAREIGYTLQRLGSHPRVPIRRGLGLLLRVAHDHLLAGAGALALVSGTQLPLLLHPAQRGALLQHPALWIAQAAFGVLAVLTLLVWHSDRRLRPARPPSLPSRDRVLEVLSLPLLGLLATLTVTLPVLHAQMRLLRGKSLRFRVTPKT